MLDDQFGKFDWPREVHLACDLLYPVPPRRMLSIADMEDDS